MTIHAKDTRFGFEYGAAKVERFCADEKKGWVVIGITTPKSEVPMQVYVTKTGKVRVFHNGEWKRT